MQSEMTIIIERQLCNEREAPRPLAHPVLIALYHSNGLDPMNRTNDGAVAVPDLGRVRDIPDIGFLVRDTTPHAQPEAVVVSAVAQPLHGDCGTLRLNLETDEMAIVGGDVKCRLAYTPRPSVVNEYRIDLDAAFPPRPTGRIVR